MQGFVLNIEKIKKIRKDVYIEKSFPGGSDGKESACSAGDPVPGSGRFSREGMATHSSILAGGFHGQRNVVDSQSMGLQRVGHD